MGTAVGGERAVPRYVQIAEEIVQQIRAGVLKPGEMVPSESELVDRYGVSGGTIRKAMVEVRASGLVETRHGKGSIVKDRPPVRHRSSDRFRRSHRQSGKAAYLAESAQSGATAKVSVLYIGPMEAPRMPPSDWASPPAPRCSPGVASTSATAPPSRPPRRTSRGMS
ncbi:Trehalose operon transcriptional repressor [Streptomyces sp. MBT84]|nr:Trehalose operon transcriptional repressor [Streptomyces sp. MBT84]